MKVSLQPLSWSQYLFLSVIRGLFWFIITWSFWIRNLANYMFPFSSAGNIQIFPCTILYRRPLCHTALLRTLLSFSRFFRNMVAEIEIVAEIWLPSRLVVLQVLAASCHFWQVILVKCGTDINLEFVPSSSTPLLLYFNQTTKRCVLFSSGCILFGWFLFGSLFWRGFLWVSILAWQRVRGLITNIKNKKNL